MIEGRTGRLRSLMGPTVGTGVLVLALVAAGRSNREIGSQLFIASKTVSVHVSNILAKLGVSGRVQAAAVAHRLSAAGPSPDGAKASAAQGRAIPPA